MFKKKPTEAPVTEERPVVQPVKTEEISPEEESKEETQETTPQEELTEEDFKAVLQKLVTDVQAIKYHLRLDFI